MKIAMMQPAFLPWQGFFELISKSDLFIILDDFQFSVQSYHQRNRLFVSKEQIDWYTIPIVKSSSVGKALNDAEINSNPTWRIKMWKRIQQNYSKAAYFGEISPLIEQWLLNRKGTLAEFNCTFIEIVCRLLKIDTEIRLSSQFKTPSRRSEKVLDLLHWVKATKYLCAKGAFGYMKEDAVFPVDDIEILFQDYNPRQYSQVGSPNKFVPFLSVLDALLNIGPGQTIDLINNGTDKWLTWDNINFSQNSDNIEIHSGVN